MSRRIQDSGFRVQRGNRVVQPFCSAKPLSPFHLAWLTCQSWGVRDFTTELFDHLDHGFVYALPKMFLMAKAVELPDGGIAASDLRLKENIVRVGTSPSGIPIVEFNYNTFALALDPALDLTRRWRGVIAQEVEKIKPEAVIELYGFKFVNYELIDATFEEITEDLAAAPPTHRVEYGSKTQEVA